VRRLALIVIGGCLAFAVALGGCVAALDGAADSGSDAPSVAGRQLGLAVPAAWEALEEDAAAHCPGLPWSVLSAVGRVESDSGRSSAPGVVSGANIAGAEGPMQFEPSTFARYGVVGPGGVSPPSPYDPVDAIYSAAHLLCSDGAARPSTLARAIDAYNHSPVYVATVLVLAEALDADPTLLADAAAAIQFAAAQLGTPYRWGGSGPGGFDCSGLTQAALRSAGVSLPRVAQAQFDAGPTVDSGNVRPGDLLFYGTSTRAVDHVGIYVGAGEMIDAPHTGAVVREEPASWDDFVGATRPG
jgi:cell wall-associated NlpC family hydrolase